MIYSIIFSILVVFILLLVWRVTVNRSRLRKILLGSFTIILISFLIFTANFASRVIPISIDLPDGLSQKQVDDIIVSVLGDEGLKNIIKNSGYEDEINSIELGEMIQYPKSDLEFNEFETQISCYNERKSQITIVESIAVKIKERLEIEFEKERGQQLSFE